MAKKLTILLMHELDAQRDVYEWKINQNIESKTTVDSFDKEQDALKFIAEIKRDYTLYAFSEIGKLTYIFDYDSTNQEYSVTAETAFYENDKKINGELKLLSLFKDKKLKNIQLINESIEVPKDVKKIIFKSKEDLKEQSSEAKGANGGAFVRKKRVGKSKETANLISKTLLKKSEEIQKDISKEEQKAIGLKLKYNLKNNKRKAKQKSSFLEKQRHASLLDLVEREAEDGIKLNKVESKKRYNLVKEWFDNLINELKAEDVKETAKLISKYDELKVAEEGKTKQKIEVIQEQDLASQDKATAELAKAQKIVDREKYVIDKDLRAIQSIQNKEFSEVVSPLRAKLHEIQTQNEQEIKQATEERDTLFATFEQQKQQLIEALERDKEIQESKILDNIVLTQEQILAAKDKSKLNAFVKSSKARHVKAMFELEKAFASSKRVIANKNKDLRLQKKENVKHVFKQFITSRFNTVKLELRFNEALEQWIVSPSEKYVFYNKFERSYKSKEEALVDINNYTFSSNITVYNKKDVPAYAIKKDFIKNYQTLKLLGGATDSKETIKEVTIVKPRILESKREVAGVPITLDNKSLNSRKMTHLIIMFIMVLVVTLITMIVI